MCEANRSVKKFPAPCYSPIVKFTVPSPLEALTTVFGKGTCVTPPPWAPEKITMKKGKSMEIAEKKVEAHVFLNSPMAERLRKTVVKPHGWLVMVS